MATILDVQDVVVRFAGFTALDHLSFSMEHGELRFVIGPNGAGKTTFLDVITGKAQPLSGRVMVDDRDVRGWPEHVRVRQGIGRKFQTPTVFGSLTVYENLEAASTFRDPFPRLFRSLAASRRELIDSTLDRVGLRHRALVRAGTLSHGEKQWLEIGMLLVQQPKLLLLDEPVAGMTRAERTRTGELIHAIAGQCAVLVVEHDMDFVRRFARTVTVLHMGQVLCQGPVEQVQQDPQVIEVYLGRASAAA